MTVFLYIQFLLKTKMYIYNKHINNKLKSTKTYLQNFIYEGKFNDFQIFEI